MRYREITLQRLARLETQMDYVISLLEEIAQTSGIDIDILKASTTPQNTPKTKEKVITGQISILNQNTPPKRSVKSKSNEV